MEVLFKISNNQLVLRYFNKKTVRNSLIIMFRGRCSVSTLEGHVHITSEGGPAGGGGGAAQAAPQPELLCKLTAQRTQQVDLNLDTKAVHSQQWP